MAFTYDDANLASATSVSRLRFAVGDTQEYLALLTDGEAQYLIATHGTADDARVPAVDSMIRKCSNLADASSGSERVAHSQRLAALRVLREELVSAGATVPAGSAVRQSRTRTLARPESEGATEWA